MVLQQSNFHRNFSFSENRAPLKGAATSTLGPRIRNSIHDAARRRRARTAGGVSTPRYTVEQAKRRAEARATSGTVRFTITRPQPPVSAPTPIVDVVPSEVAPMPTPAPPATTPVQLPRYLARPEYREVTPGAIKAIDPDLAVVDIDYVRDQLEDFGPQMLQVLTSVTANPVRDVLPKELAILVNDFSSDLPSHMLAVYARPPPSGAAGPAPRRKVTLFPTHGLILAAHCAHLPPLPPSIPPLSLTPDTPLSVPVVPLCLPAPEFFAPLSAFLYTRRAAPLLRALLPAPPPPGLADAPPPARAAFAKALAGTYTAGALLQRALGVNALWRNVCALGVFDDTLWGAMDLAWEVLLTALAISTGDPQAMLAPPQPASTPTPASAPIPTPIAATS